MICWLFVIVLFGKLGRFHRKIESNWRHFLSHLCVKKIQQKNRSHHVATECGYFVWPIVRNCIDSSDPNKSLNSMVHAMSTIVRIRTSVREHTNTNNFILPPPVRHLGFPFRFLCKPQEKWSRWWSSFGTAKHSESLTLTHYRKF